MDKQQYDAEDAFFIDTLEQLGKRDKFKLLLKDIHSSLFETGEVREQAGGRVIGFLKKYRRTIAVAASIAGIVAISISGLFSYFTPKGSVSEIKQLSKEIKEVKYTQRQAFNEINQLKNNSYNGPAVPGKLGGTGFLIDPRGYLVTSAHVVNTADSIYVENGKGDYFKATRVYINDTTDVAVLKIDDKRFQPYRNIPYLLRKSSAELGEKIFTLGYPRSEIVYNEGYLSAKTGYDGDTMTYQLAISANPGNSGGPIFNNSGEIIGILSGKQTTAEGVVFSSKAANIYQALNEIKKESNVRLSPGAASVRGMDRVQQIKKIQSCIFVVKSY
ncbi:MAG TPA: serine protease [Chitinophagaceae bacterium]|nr:serine protease [Chitinophagaceae bacterium]